MYPFKDYKMTKMFISFPFRHFKSPIAPSVNVGGKHLSCSKVVYLKISDLFLFFKNLQQLYKDTGISTKRTFSVYLSKHYYSVYPLAWYSHE